MSWERAVIDRYPTTEPEILDDPADLFERRFAMSPVNICVHGATGRMGRALVELTQADARLCLVGAVVSPESRWRGQLVAGSELHYSSEFPEDAAVIVDFSLPPALPMLCATAKTLQIPVVSGTTGLDEAGTALLDDLSTHVPVLWAANFSLGVAVLRRLCRQAATLLPHFDVAISESHHRHKVDAPSGTALRLGEAIAQVSGHTPAYSSIRLSSVVGTHSVLFGGEAEILELKHEALDRRLFAMGALQAARWLTHGERAARRYDIDDVLDAADNPAR